MSNHDFLLAAAAGKLDVVKYLISNKQIDINSNEIFLYIIFINEIEILYFYGIYY